MYVFDLGADTFAQWLLGVGSTTLCEAREAVTLRGCAVVGWYSVTCLGWLCPPLGSLYPGGGTGGLGHLVHSRVKQIRFRFFLRLRIKQIVHSLPRILQCIGIFWEVLGRELRALYTATYL